VNVGPVAGIDTIAVYGINSCDTEFPKIITRIINPRPQPHITGMDTTCTGIENQFSTSGGKNNYQWAVSTGGTIVSGGTATDSICSVIWNSVGSNWISVNYPEATGCEALSPTQFDVWVYPGPTVSVSITASANPVCEGIPILFTANPVNGGNSPLFQWNVNGENQGSNSPAFIYTPVCNLHSVF
jgi:hypothetical protein